MADYVTQGIVQVEINDTDQLVRINPSQNYAVKHNGKNYIIFMPVVASANATVFEVVEVFTATGRPDVTMALINAASNSTNINIVVEFPNTSSSTNIAIKSIKIPATF